MSTEQRSRLVHITTVPTTLTFLRGQVSYIQQRGYAIHAVSSPGIDLMAFGRDEGVTVHAITLLRRISPLQDLHAVTRMVALLRRIAPTIVHAHTPKGGLVGMVAAAIARVPVRIYHIHGLPFVTAAGMRRRLLIASERTACALAHKVMCVSHSVAELAVREGICPADKLSVLCRGSSNGVDAARRFAPTGLAPDTRKATRARLRIPADAKVIGFIGRLVRDKGVEELEAAWQSLRAEYPDLHLVLVGPLEPQDPVPRQVRARLEADPRVHLAGMDWETPPYYAAMDIVAMPTYREGFPNVPLEAAAMELPVVATRVPGCVDAVEDGITGTLVPARDADALAAAIRRYLEDPELRRRHGMAGRLRVLRDFRQELIWEAMHQEYRRLLLQRGFALPPLDGDPAVAGMAS